VEVVVDPGDSPASHAIRSKVNDLHILLLHFLILKSTALMRTTALQTTLTTIIHLLVSKESFPRLYYT
jgi:hypothetical protein